MTKLATLLAWLVPVAAVAPMALAHCGGDDSNTTFDAGKPGSGSSSGSASSSGSSSGSSSSGGTSTVTPGTDGSVTPVGDGSTTPTGEGGADGSTGTPPIPVPEGGAASDPGSVVCNGAPCDVSTGHTCCYARTDGGSTETCLPPNGGCDTSNIACNEAADCNGGICCQTIIGVGLQGSTFCTSASAKACPATSAMYPQGTFQTCRTDDECGRNSDAGALKRCVPQQCTNPENASATVMVEACAAPISAVNDAGTLGFCKPL
jgi:hypothetical protein